MTRNNTLNNVRRVAATELPQLLSQNTIMLGETVAKSRSQTLCRSINLTEKNFAPCGTDGRLLLSGFQLAYSWPWPWPWIGSYGIPSCISHRPLSTHQMSLKSEKLFCGRT